MEKVFEIYIRTTPERLWEVITNPEIRSKYHFGSRIESDCTLGSRFEMVHPGSDDLLGEGENLEVDPPRKLSRHRLDRRLLGTRDQRRATNRPRGGSASSFERRSTGVVATPTIRT